LHDTFATPQTAFAAWLHDPSFAVISRGYEGRCLACTQPTLATSIDENLAWLLEQLASLPGPFDIVAHGRGGLLARALAVDGRLPLRRVCQVGTPNKGTMLARESHLPRFLDAHVAMLAHLPAGVAQSTLEGALCMARFLAQGLRAALPGVEVLTPDSAPLRALADFSAPGLKWFTIGARFTPPEGHVEMVEEFDATPNDLLVPTQGCHEPGIPVTESLRLAGIDTHHHNYFANARVRECLAAWLLEEST
jgi:pimeloyl-ACP methyl ester carboxylesterase